MRSKHHVLIGVFVVLLSISSAADLRTTIVQSSDEQLIRAARARSNQAIAAHDLAGIARIWMEDVHVVSSTSAQTAGREANQQRMAKQFSNRPDTIYIRRTTAIDVYSPWTVAAERGEWTGRWTEPDGSLEIAGTYLAQWRKVDGQWLIQAELFVPIASSVRRPIGRMTARDAPIAQQGREFKTAHRSFRKKLYAAGEFGFLPFAIDPNNKPSHRSVPFGSRHLEPEIGAGKHVWEYRFGHHNRLRVTPGGTAKRRQHDDTDDQQISKCTHRSSSTSLGSTFETAAWPPGDALLADRHGDQ